MSDPSVSIIILNWNGWLDTVECLESIYNLNYSNYQVIVVDNNSSDDSIQKINDYTMGKLEVKSNFFKYIVKSKMRICTCSCPLLQMLVFVCKKTNFNKTCAK